jgi:hypothetical protein
MRSVTIIAVAVLCLHLAPASAEPPRVTGRYTPPPPVRTVEPRELWRVTEGNEETGDVLGEIKDATVDAAGNTYLLDASFNTVRIYDPAGKPLGTLGRAGEGPGEFSNPRGCLALADGRVGVAQFLPARIVTFDRDGNPGPDLVPPETGAVEMMESVQATAGGVYLCTHSMIMGGEAPRSVMRLRSLALDGSQRALFKEASHAVGRNGVFSSTASDGTDFSRHWAAGTDGRVFVAQRPDAYEIEVFAPDGALERVIDLEYEHVKRSDAEMEALAARGASESGHGPSRVGNVNPVLRDIAALYARPDGMLWVASSRGDRDRPAGSVGAFDVFDREGRFTSRIALAADYDPETDEFVISGNRLYVLKEALMAPTTVATVSGGGTVAMSVGTPDGRDQGDQESRPYSVVCYALDGI